MVKKAGKVATTLGKFTSTTSCESATSAGQCGPPVVLPEFPVGDTIDLLNPLPCVCPI